MREKVNREQRKNNCRNDEREIAMIRDKVIMNMNERKRGVRGKREKNIKRDGR